jgi:hypothetical protein
MYVCRRRTLALLIIKAYMTLADLQFLNNVIINKTKVLLLQA